MQLHKNLVQTKHGLALDTWKRAEYIYWYELDKIFMSIQNK